MDDAVVTVKNDKGEAEKLILLNADEAKRMLGVYLSADRKHETQKKYLRKVCDD